MSAVLEAPTKQTNSKRKRTPGTWTAEQAHAANLKSRIAKRTKAEQRKLAKLNKAPEPKPTSPPDPLGALTHSLAVAAKRNQGKLAVNLATALAKLKSAQSKPSASNTPTSCSPVRQPTPATPQAAQDVEPKHSIDGANYSQYTEHLVGQGKESLNQAGVGAGLPRQAPVDSPIHGVIARITRRLENMTLVELEGLERQLQPKVTEGTKVTSVGLEPKAPIKLEDSGMEKFLVGGVWVWGRRKK